jgi:hypothetical protein
MPSLNDALATTPEQRTAALPPVPQMELIPTLSDAPTIIEMYRDLVWLHYAAFVTLHGPPPDRVDVHPATLLGASRLSFPTRLATLARTADHAAVEWFHAFEAGLSRWRDADFPNPLTFEPSDPGMVLVTMDAPDVVLATAVQRLICAGRTDRLANLHRIL